jgi:hypothetical protein
MKKIIVSSVLAASGFLALGAQAQAATLDDVMSAGELRCGVSNGHPVFRSRIATVTGPDSMWIRAARLPQRS